MSKITDAIARAEQDRQLHWTPMRLSARMPSETVPTPTAPAIGTPTTSVIHPRPAAPAAPTAPVAGQLPLDQAVEAVKQRLAQREQQAARLAQQQLRINAQLTATDQLQAQLEQDRVTLRRQLVDLERSAAAIDAEKTASLQQLDALRECQMLSHAVRVAEQDLSVNTTIITQAVQSQQRAMEELARHRQQGDVLQREVAHLRARLAQALTATGTTEKSA